MTTEIIEKLQDQVARGRRSWRVPALILLTLIIGEAWLAAHYISTIEGWLR